MPWKKMIDFLSSWGQGIIVAVIIGTIIEMILPEGSSKKYIKVVIGIYILFTIISPFIQKFSGSKLSAENILNTEKYEKMMAKGSNTISKKIEDNNSRTIKDIYTENLKTDIKAKLKEKGYEAESIYLRVSDDGNYTIEKLQIKLLATENKNNGNTETKKVEINSVNVEKIEIAGDGKTNSVKEKNKNTVLILFLFASFIFNFFSFSNLINIFYSIFRNNWIYSIISNIV